MTDAELAAAAAEAAGRELLRIRRQGGAEGRALGELGDRLANGIIVDLLRRHRPDDGLLSEESADEKSRLSKERVWIVDPLDGTREFAEGRDDWAVHVALAVRGEPVVGAVALPAEGILLRSDRPMAAPQHAGAPRMVVSRTRAPAVAAAVAAAIGAELVPMGSAGAKVGAVLLSRAEIYVHSGGQYEWDSCAPAAVALAHGLIATRLDGSPLGYNRPDPYLPDLLVCAPSLEARVRQTLLASLN